MLRLNSAKVCGQDEWRREHGPNAIVRPVLPQGHASAALFRAPFSESAELQQTLTIFNAGLKAHLQNLRNSRASIQGFAGTARTLADCHGTAHMYIVHPIDTSLWNISLCPETSLQIYNTIDFSRWPAGKRHRSFRSTYYKYL